MNDGSATTASVRDVRVPADKVELLERLTEGGWPFPAMRDVLVFAAAVGWSQHKALPIEKAARDRIRWGTMTNRPGTEDLVSMLAIAVKKDPNILSPERFAERIEIFESFANGGLAFIDQLITNQPHRDLISLLVDLVRSGIEDPGTTEDSSLPDEVSRLAKGLI